MGIASFKEAILYLLINVGFALPERGTFFVQTKICTWKCLHREGQGWPRAVQRTKGRSAHPCAPAT